MTHRRPHWRLVAIALGTTLAAGALLAQQPDTAAMALRLAVDTELVKGDPEAAIKAYQAIVDTYGKTDRAVAAEALLRIAECYRKLGDVQARRIYERVISQFGDQREPASAARARIAADASEVRNRLVWSVPALPHFWGHVSPNGRFFAYGGGFNGDLFVRDLSLGIDRRLTNSAKPGTPPSRADREGYGDDFSAFSRDDRWLAHAWRVGSREELRLVDLQAQGMPSPRVLMNAPDIRFVTAFDWSPDGRSIAVGIWRTKATSAELGVLSVGNAEFRSLKRLPEASGDAIGNGVMFSPDGRYLVYNPDREAGDSAREVVIIDVETAVEQRLPIAPKNDKVIGWSPDGSIVFSSDRTGTLALWYAPFKDGIAGQPRPLDASPFGIGPATWWHMGLTTSGALFYRVFPPSRTDVRIATVNFDTGRLESSLVNAATDFIGVSSQPSVSPRGSHLAFTSRRSEQDVVLIVRDLASGVNRELRPGLPTLSCMSWAPDASALYCTSRSPDRSRVYRIDARSGLATPLVESGVLRSVSTDGRTLFYEDTAAGAATLALFELNLATGQSHEVHRGAAGGAFRLAIAPNGNAIYYRNPVAQSPGPNDIVAKDLGSGQERVLAAKRSVGALYLSPDGRYIVTPSTDANRQTVLLVATDGSDVRDLADGMQFQAWAPDSRSIIARREPQGSPQPQNWVVPVDGRQPFPLELPDAGENIRNLTAGGKWLAFVEANATPAPWAAGESQIWVLENFLPRPQGAPGAGRR